MDNFFEVKESKYAHLLQPIRELAANWDVNIATDLEDYLDDLESVSFSFEDGQSLNFAEAALLIQGSTCIFSKKVEHLYNLVYQALQRVSTTHAEDGSDGQSPPNARERDTSAAISDEADAALFADPDAAIAIADDIALTEDDDACNHVGIRVPSALLALEDHGSALEDADSSSRFHISQCYVHSSGALLLELRDFHRYDSNLRLLHSGTPSRYARHAPPTLTPIIATTPAASPHPSLLSPGQPFDSGPADDDYDPPHHQPDNHQQYPANGLDQSQHHNDAGFEAPDPSPAFQQIDPGGDEEEEENEEEVFDPYEPLDPNDPGSCPIVPMKVVLPRTLHVQVHRSKRAPTAPSQAKPPAAKGLFYPEFRYLLQASRTRAQQQQQRRPHADDHGAASAAHSSRHRMQSVLDWVDAAAAAQQEAEAMEEMLHGGLHDGDDGDDDGGGDGGGFDGADGEFEFDDGGVEQQVGWAGEGGAGDNARLDEPGPMGQDGGAGLQWPQGVDTGAASYEELCRAHIETLLSAASAREVQSELAVRVARWRQQIDPMLRDETRHGAFDIQEYGQQILSRMAARTSRAEEDEQLVSFGDVAAGSRKREVSRMFAAMLQLINNRNVGIHKQRSGAFQLELLSGEQPHQQMAARMQGTGGPPAAAPAAGAEEGPAEDGEQQQQQQQASPSKPPKAKKQRKGRQNIPAG